MREFAGGGGLVFVDVMDVIAHSLFDSLNHFVNFLIRPFNNKFHPARHISDVPGHVMPHGYVSSCKPESHPLNPTTKEVLTAMHFQRGQRRV